MKQLSESLIQQFKQHLICEEKSSSTVAKYVHDVTVFAQWCKDRDIDKNTVLYYKQKLIDELAPASVNATLSSLNSFFIFTGRNDLRVKRLKIQKQIFSSKDKELTKAEYQRLLEVAKSKQNQRLYMVMQTICSCGIRVSELKYITVEAVRTEKAIINCKGKMRLVILPKQLCKMLKVYIKENKLLSGSIFITRTGKPLDRSNIWSSMKKLCKIANVPDKKVFPHNFRHLFARTYYSLHKDIVRLADILGHSSVNTTRIYTMESSDIHRHQIQLLGLLRC